MIEATLNKAIEHAKSVFPKDSCGLAVVVTGKEVYYPCANLGDTPSEHFKMSHEDFARAEDLGEVIALIHSHPNMVATASEGDLVSCEANGIEWHILSLFQENGEIVFKGINSIKPKNYEAPLVGRMFYYGVLDCYTLIRDYYKRTLNMDLPMFQSEDEWWLKGKNLYVDHYKEVGFVDVTGSMQPHDVIFMQIRSPVANHAGAYLGDGLFLHHFYGRLSTKDVYGGYWQHTTVKILRHKDFL